MSSLVTGSAFGFSGPDWIGSNIMKDRNREDAQIAFDRTADFQERMANTAWQRGVKDMQAAGINPMLAIQQGSASSPTPQMPLPHSSLVSGGGNVSKQYQTGPAADALRAEADKLHAEADEVRARTPTHAVNIEQMRQNISESIARIEQIRAAASEHTASAARQYQQAENLRAELPRIRAETTKLLQQAMYYAADTTLKTAEEKQLQQVIKANLPEIQRAHQELIVALQRIDQPGKELDADARQSFIGILGGYLKALLPAGSLVGAIPFGNFGNKAPSTPDIIHKGTGRNAPDIHRR